MLLVNSLKNTRVLFIKGSTLHESTRLLSTNSIELPGSVQRQKRILSGVQPTGALHLGNYLGAIRQWVDLQHKHDSYFCVVDLHALTNGHNPKELSQNTLQSAAMYLACGIDPLKSKIFVQSHVSAHAELTWMLNCVTPVTWLDRMIQFKEKAIKHGVNVAVGLYDYPVLMAADILLYQTDLVPVGDDQRQHLELTRDIARRFNDQFPSVTNLPDKRRGRKIKSEKTESASIYLEMSPGVSGKNTAVGGSNSGIVGTSHSESKVFREPEAMIVAGGARVMSILDGTSKMSKSAENDNSRINLLDSPDLIRRKIKTCKTDSTIGLEWHNSARPECTNLLNIYQAVTGKSSETIESEVTALNWGKFKPLLADAIVAHLEPIQMRHREVMQDPGYLEKVLAEGAEAANLVASSTLNDAKRAMGILLPK
jgi:tryptophanyl-tRNA synthetase